ncbi:hypothetical protein ID855_01880 [Xenorhabdus sp. ZM]|uniref:hypothetical protein n=1 Tax=Xenorhabdus szentirmaii TaxID=290112 RepID=UPI001984729B|nr:hypothetical protein [Xenorhabdus sp. ZM]MBD2803481.1 hypothetical protein [Xenorhabdus sp. ZM]
MTKYNNLQNQLSNYKIQKNAYEDALFNSLGDFREKLINYLEMEEVVNYGNANNIKDMVSLGEVCNGIFENKQLTALKMNEDNPRKPKLLFAVKISTGKLENGFYTSDKHYVFECSLHRTNGIYYVSFINGDSKPCEIPCNETTGSARVDFSPAFEHIFQYMMRDNDPDIFK